MSSEGANGTDPDGRDESDPEAGDGSGTVGADGTDGGFDIPIKKGIAYLAGGLLIYSGVASIGSSLPRGGLKIFLGVAALPVVRGQLSPSKRVVISRWTKVLVVIFIVLASGNVFGFSLVPESVSGPLRDLLT